MNGLINSLGNYAVITDVSKTTATATVFETKADYDNGPDKFFGKTTPKTFQCGQELHDALNNTTASGQGGKSVADNVIIVAENTIAAQALVDPVKHQLTYPDYAHGDQIEDTRPGDWQVGSVWVAPTPAE